MVLAYFHKWAPLNELRLECGVSRDGSKAVNIWKAGKKYGLDIKSFRAEPHSLRSFTPPMILHWNFNHFVVLEGIAKGRVFLNDPASGHRIVDENELDESFTGVVMVCEPSESFVPGGRKPSFTQELGRRLRGSWVPIAFIVLSGFVLMALRLTAPFFSKLFIENVLLSGSDAWLRPILLWMALVAVMAGTLAWLQQMSLNRFEIWITLKETSRLFWHILRLPVEFFGRRFAGDLASRLTLTSRVAEILSRDLAINFLNAIMVLLFGVLMLRYNPTLTGACLAFIALNVAALYLVSRKRIDDNRRLLAEDGKLHSSILGGLDMIEVVRAAGAEADVMARWTGYQAKIINIQQELEGRSVWLEAVPPLLMAFNTAVILAVGSLQVLEGRLSLGGLVAFNLLLAAFLTPVARLVGLGGKLQLAAGDLNRLDDVLSYPAELDSYEATVPMPLSSGRLAGGVEMKNVSFGYNRLEPPLIQGFHIRIRRGALVALVGPSGSGKSTLAKLISGVLDPWHGEILFDNRLRSELPRSTLVSSIAIVEQATTLFEGTVRDNLTLWNAEVPMDAVRAAAEDAAIDEDIMARPGGYEGLVEQSGRNWSGGQRQRLEIARALVLNPSLLILDEATSALDPRLESVVHERLRRRGCTCLIVAHRLSTIRDADEIIVLENGRVVQRGTHPELIAHQGLYHALASQL